MRSLPAAVRTAGLTAILAISPLTAERAAADSIVLASLPIVSHVGAMTDLTEGRFTFAMTPTSTIRLFTGYPITHEAVGTTLVADASNDPHFAQIARQLTNGVGNYTEWLFGFAPGTGGGVGSLGEGRLFGLPAHIPDFRGASLTALTLRVDAFSLVTREAGFRELRFKGLLSVVGEGTLEPVPVPEPATLTLLATGALGLAAARRRRGRG